VSAPVIMEFCFCDVGGAGYEECDKDWRGWTSGSGDLLCSEELESFFVHL